MFTGIVEGLGTVKDIVCLDDKKTLTIELPFKVSEISIGDSISVSGVCLTAIVINLEKNYLVFDLATETLAVTNLGLLKIGSAVNIERALKIGDRLNGHFVSGHIDCVGNIKDIIKVDNTIHAEVEFNNSFRKFLIKKGSITVDGVSLTLGDITDETFKVYVIPHTANITLFSNYNTGSAVNIEFDMLGKFVLNRSEQLK